MEYKKKPQSSAPAVQSPKVVTQAAPVQPVDPVAQRQLELKSDLLAQTLRPVSVQRQVVQPAFRAAALHTGESKRLAAEHQTLQREAADLGPISPEAMTQALQRQPEVAPQVPLKLKPQNVGDWVTVMRFQAQQAQGRRMGAKEAAQYTALQRQVANTIAQSFRQDRQTASERHQQYAGHLATLQGEAGSAVVATAALNLMPASERPAVQRALDEALQREAVQQAQDQAALKLHSIQRQLADLEQEATQPVFERIQQRRGAGNPLPEAIQRHLEHGLNHDLSQVRIHDDAEADKLAKKVNAVAFTTGQDIYFRSGKFNPNSQSGLELLAHEVTHTVQQARGEVGPGIDPSARHEAQAREMGRKAARQPINWTAKAGKLPARSAPLTMGHAIQRQKAPKAPPMSAADLQKITKAFEEALKKGDFAKAAQEFYKLPENKRGPIAKRLLEQYQKQASQGRPVNRPGDKPWNYHFGSVVHEDIAEYYAQKHKGEQVFTNNKSVKTIARDILGKEPKMVEKPGKNPDIVNKDKLNIYEIKSKNDAAKGRKQLLMYLKAFWGMGVRMQPGPSSDVGVNGIAGTEGGFIVFYSPEPGLVLYERRVTKAQQTANAPEMSLDKIIIAAIIAFLIALINAASGGGAARPAFNQLFPGLFNPPEVI